MRMLSEPVLPGAAPWAWGGQAGFQDTSASSWLPNMKAIPIYFACWIASHSNWYPQLKFFGLAGMPSLRAGVGWLWPRTAKTCFQTVPTTLTTASPAPLALQRAALNFLLGMHAKP
eukprot:1137104-Pelagomonas_calceolata.AAC.2